MKTLQTLQNINPENPIEESIKNDFLELYEFQGEDLSTSVISSELRDDPEAYDYTKDDLDQFISKYNLTY